MNNMNFWNNNTEILFFKEAIKNFASVEQLFYKLRDGYFAYIPKGLDAEGQTLQARNSLIGQFTERWAKDLLNPVAEKLGLFAVNGVVCEEIGLTRSSSADLAFCKKDSINQKASDIKIIFEIKMSIVSNYQYFNSDTIILIGDYKKHKGNPSLLRSDSMLKAIGKSINIRVSGFESAHIPIVILGNSPITNNYLNKVDYLKECGVVQHFLSLNPNPTLSTVDYVHSSPKNGFLTISSEEMLMKICRSLVESELHYFSSMICKKDLGQIIKISSKEKSDEKIAEKFLSLIHIQNGY
ncbi:MAG: hypothetical protein PHN41_07085 [Bacteroidales bacterium]|jgi:hypothetical protein|nr:hypothetical protein [Bacteroidales bacterium]MDD4703071.1 hypothetical protein [Bacteroidales bacterium]MDX9797851.1 hypothetical protein [Bacteroidales bacterium]